MTTAPTKKIRPFHQGREQQTIPSAEALIRQAHVLLADAGVQLSPSKVIRLARDYRSLVAHKGVTFPDFLANTLLVEAAKTETREAI